jgi:1-acyl-sn-glycerol-3-phosphate acyltransferase
MFWGIISITSIIYNPGGTVAFFCMRWWSKTALWFCRVRLTVQGIENIKPGTIQIFAANHSSHFDIFVLSALLPVRFGWVAKNELFKIPFLGWHMKLQGYVSIDRKHRDKAIESLNYAAEQIRNGKRIAMFPEGTRTREGELQPFKKGLFHLCVRTGVPIVPIIINGTYKVLKPESLIIHPGDVCVNIGEELHTEGYTPDTIEDLMADLKERMEELQHGMSTMRRTSTDTAIAPR